MSNDWFRSWHGAPTDPKWRTIAKRAKVASSLVVAIAWALMDRASQSTDRGSINGLDHETIADFLDCEPTDVERVICALRDKEILDGDRFVAWERRQPKRQREDDNSTERGRAFRKRHKNKDIDKSKAGVSDDETPANASQRQPTPREDERREDTEKKESSLRSDDSAGAPKSKTPREVLETCLSPKTAADVIAHRKAKNARLTERAAELLVESFLAFGDAEKAAQIMIERGWNSFRADWMKNQQARAGPAPPKRNPYFADMERSLETANGHATRNETEDCADRSPGAFDPTVEDRDRAIDEIAAP